MVGGAVDEFVPATADPVGCAFGVSTSAASGRLQSADDEERSRKQQDEPEHAGADGEDHAECQGAGILLILGIAVVRNRGRQIDGLLRGRRRLQHLGLRVGPGLRGLVVRKLILGRRGIERHPSRALERNLDPRVQRVAVGGEHAGAGLVLVGVEAHHDAGGDAELPGEQGHRRRVLLVVADHLVGAEKRRDALRTVARA